MKRLRKLRPVLLVPLFVALLCGVALAASPRGEVLQDGWYALYLAGQKAGWHHVRSVRSEWRERKVVNTTLHQEIAVSRAGVTIEMATDTTVVETPDGRVLAFEQKITQGPTKRAVRGEVSGQQMEVKTSTGGGQSTRTVPAPRGLGPWAERRLRLEKGFEPGTTYAAKVFAPEAPGRDVSMELTVGPEESVQIYEVEKDLHRLEVTYSILPGVVTREWMDEDGTSWLAEMAPGPGLKIEMRRAPEELATAPSAPAELLASSYVVPDRALARPRALEKLRVAISPKKPDYSLPEPPESAGQKVERAADGGLRLSVRRVGPPDSAGYELPYRGSRYAPLLQSNSWLELEDETVQRLTRRAVGETADPVVAARRIESFVAGHIEEKNLSLGMATAAETARQMRGDCTEHAVLTAAMARAAGIPSRVVGGLVYAQFLPGARSGGFGYHMWTEVYVGEWYPLDAALGGHDATHLALFQSDLNNTGNMVEMSGRIVQFLGRIEIRVLEAQP
ncbi:MAG: transglutaminase-like domain-containing protein [Planctomycetota bacterium]